MKKRNALKLSLSLSLENSHSLIDAIARNPENANVATNVNDLFKAVDSVSDADVNSVSETFDKMYYYSGCINFEFY